jgi:hypothetical protein
MDRGALAMTTLHAALLLVLVLGTAMVALAVDVGALLGLIMRRWR